MSVALELPDPESTEALGGRLARCLGAGVLFLHGDLGAGKTTLVRGFLRALGHLGNVKSPTYTLVEPYDTATGPVFHFDLYRLVEPEELEFMGIRDFFTREARCLVEWPDKGSGFLPPADLSVTLVPEGGGRRARVDAHTPVGEVALRCLRAG